MAAAGTKGEKREKNGLGRMGNFALHTSPRQYEKGEYFPPPPLTFHKSWEEGRTRGGPPPPPPLHSKYGEEGGGEKGIQEVLFPPYEEKDSLELVEGEEK